MKKLLLASKSPRRSEILSEFGFDFLPHTIEISEILNKNLNLDDQIRDLAVQKICKARTSFNLLKLKDFIVLSADTMVVLEGHALGKPENSQEAIKTLGLLSGRSHEVKTAVALYNGETEELRSFVVTTRVHFHSLSQSEIVEYVETGESMDKAGSYGIQGLGGGFVQGYEGSYWNVVGLPVEELEKRLSILNWSVGKSKTRRDELCERFHSVCKKINKDIQLVAVSKRKSVEDIFSLYELGQRVFAENYVKEALLKQNSLRGKAPDISWHFIGRLQRNKVKDVVGHFDLIHSIDREGLFIELEKQIEKQYGASFQQKILLQVNIAEEEGKGGINEENFFVLLDKVLSSPYVKFCGLMCLPPLIANEKKQRVFFRRMKVLLKKVENLCVEAPILSMGTSGDFELAIEEGANMVRIGSSIFGVRD